MNVKHLLFATFLLITGSLSVTAQVNVDVTLNMKHSVDNVSDFGRERHMTIHSNFHETDWDGEEDKLDYLINELGVSFGRETGSAGWKNNSVEEDPNHPHWPNEAQMRTHGNGLKQWYETSAFDLRRQYEANAGNMIMGINDHCPMYPTLSWDKNFGKGAGGWFVTDVDAGAEWVSLYLDNYLAKSKDDIGEPLPKYWECYNEPDMNFMDPQFGMIISSLEKNWQFHNLVAKSVRERLGKAAPSIGGMTWGLLDFYKPDGEPTRQTLDYWTKNLEPDNPMIPVYKNMLSGIGSGIPNPGIGNSVWPKAWDNRTKNWWQWDYLYQGFIDYSGKEMDFYGLHLYDWPAATEASSTIRSGGQTEATLDMLEWYDNLLFNKKKDIVLSEFGSVSGLYIPTLPARRRDWEFLKPFNQMFMEILERPSHIVMSMPFAPTKAVWGASFETVTYNADKTKIINTFSNIKRYDGATLFDPIGSWTGDPSTGTMNAPTGGWDWSPIIYYFELWKDVEGTRIDTKSNDRDVQVDAYVLENHMYLIVNNCISQNKTVNLNLFNNLGTISSVELRHLYFDPKLGTQGEPTLSKAKMTAAPSCVTLLPNSTMVLDYTFANQVAINQESKETKYMCKPLTNGKNDRGTQLCHTPSVSSITATIKDVVAPAKGEAVVRIGGFFANPTDGLKDRNAMRIKQLTVNGNPVIVEADAYEYNPRGVMQAGYQGGWFGMLEIDIPAGYLKNGDNEIVFARYQGVEFTTILLQVFDMSAVPGRSSNGSVALTSISLGGAASLMQGVKMGIVPTYTPADATNKGLTWTSSNTSIATVDANGVVTAVAGSGTATITATSTTNASIVATKTITVKPFVASTVSSLTIAEGSTITVDQFINTALTLELTPKPEYAPEIEWTSSNDSMVRIVSPGRIIGKVINGSAVVTAKVKGTNISDQITVKVRIAGEESVYVRELPDFLRPFTSFEVSVPVNIMGDRSVTVELLKNGTVLGSGTTNVSAYGLTTANVTYTLKNAPAVGTGYQLRLTLKNGTTVLDTETKTVEMLDHIRVTSVAIADGIPLVQTGKTITRSAQVAPADAFNTAIVWSSSNPAIATVNSTTGVITGVSAGSVTIKATSAENSALFAQTTVTVQASPVKIEPVQIISPAKVSIFPSGSKTLPVEFVKAWTTERNLTWTSSNPTIASVDANGVVTAGPAEGKTSVIVTSASSPKVSDTTVVTVSYTIVVEAEDFNLQGGPQAAIATSDVGINNVQRGDYVEYVVDIPKAGDYSAAFFVGTETTEAAIQLLVDGSSVGSNTVPAGSWTTFVKISLANKFYLSKGQHTFRVLASGSSQWQWNMEHFELTYQGSNNPEGVTVTPKTVTMRPGTTETLAASVYPSSATNKNVTWSSNKPSVATVNASTGVVTGIANGTATITATTAVGSFTDFSTVTVDNNLVIMVTSITPTPASVAMPAGAKQQISVNVLPVSANNRTVTWSSSNESVATVSSAGLITAVSNGSAIITISANDASGIKTTVAVSVSDIITIQAEDLTSTGGTYLDGNHNNMNVVPGVGVNYVNTGDWAEYTLSVAQAGSYSITYYIATPTTANANIACLVDGTLISTDAVPVTAGWEDYKPLKAASNATLSAGTHIFRIQASGAAWQWNLDKIELTRINTNDKVTGVALDKNALTLSIGNTGQLVATVIPATATNKNVSWKSSNTSIATVDNNGLVTAVGVGSAIITVTTNEGSFTDNCTVTVEAIHLTNINIVETLVALKLNATQQLTTTFTPANATNQSVTWKSSNTTVATVSASGMVTAVGYGEATITVTSNDGGLTDSCSIHIATIPVTSVSVSPVAVTLGVNATQQLTATVLPIDATDKSVKWTSDNAAVATVDANGMVTTLAAGNAVIQVKTNDGGYIATSTITVEAASSSLTVQAENFTATGGTYSGFKVYTVNGVTAINWNQTGDWGEYKVVIPQEGSYSVEYFVGTTVTGGAIEFILDGTTVMKDIVPNTGNWDVFTSLKAAKTVNLTAGTHTIRLLGAGTQGWEWNMDRFVLSVDNPKPTSITLNKTTSTLLVAGSETLTASYNPSTIPSSDITWSSSNVAVVTVNASGTVTAVAQGSASIIATSSKYGLTATCTYTVTAPTTIISLEAESYSSMGGVNQNGTMGGKVGTIGSITYMWEIVATDWLQYSFSVGTAGEYEIAFVAASNQANQNIQYTLDGKAISTKLLTQTGSLTTFGSTKGSVNLNLTAGAHTLKLTATGTYLQWNLDKTILTRIGAVKDAEDMDHTLAQNGTLQVQVFPNPASDVLYISLANKSENAAHLVLFSSMGNQVMDEQINAEVHELSISDLPSGMYILHITCDGTIVTKRFIKD